VVQSQINAVRQSATKGARTALSVSPGDKQATRGQDCSCSGKTFEFRDDVWGNAAEELG